MSSVTTTASRNINSNTKKDKSDLGSETIYFNVYKVYWELDTFSFECMLQIKLGNVFEMKIIETLQQKYSFTKDVFTVKELKKIVEKLFSDAKSLKEKHVEHSKNEMPNIVIHDDILKQYLLSINYKNLFNSCFP